MGAFSLKSTQVLPISLNEAWDFFSRPQNLQSITPAYLGFKITSELADQMYAGQVITYKVKPLLRIPMFWMTEITHVEEAKYFVDEQRFGPYALWHHQHHFKEVQGGVEMLDIIHYKLPFGPLGSLVNFLFVRKQLKGIFDYRFRYLEDHFGRA